MPTKRPMKNTTETKTKKKRRYKVRSHLRTIITIGMIVLLAISVALTIYGLWKLVSNQVQQIIEISFIKTE